MKFLFKTLFLFILFNPFKGTYVNAQELKDSIYKKEMSKLSDSVQNSKGINVRKSLYFINKMLLLSEKKKDTLRIIAMLHYLGRSSQFITEFHQSIGYFKRELQLLKKIDLNKEKFKTLKDSPFKEIEILAQLGQNFENLGQIEKALSFYNTCVEIAEEKNLEFYKIIMPTIIGNLYFKTGDYRKALEKHYKSFNGLKKSKTIDKQTKIYNLGEVSIEISETYLKLKKQDSALWILDQGVKDDLFTFHEYSKIEHTKQRGSIYLEKNNLNKALYYLKKSKKIADKYDSINEPIHYYKDLSRCYYKLKEYDSAIFVLQKGIDTKKLNSKEFYLAEDYKLLARIFKDAGNINKSNEYYEKYVINQSLLEKSNDTIISSFHTRELDLLEKQKAKQKNKYYLIIGSTSILIIILLFILIIFHRQKKDNEIKFQEVLHKLNIQKDGKLIIDTKDKILEENNSNEISIEITQHILDGLQKLEEQSYFLKQECNAYNVAKKIKTNTSYLSKVVNTHFQKNFNTYINDLRINYAIVRLKNDTRFRKFSIQSIAKELGYKSVDSFTKYFKLRTGLNPSFYIKHLNALV